eukprot:gene14755-17434_t
MVNYMVSVDESQNSEMAIREVVNHLMNKSEDTLFMINVAEDPVLYPSSQMSSVIMVESLKAIEKKCKSILIQRANLAKHLGAKNVRAILGHDNHIGEAICKAATSKSIDYLVVGRRGMGAVKRIFLGSTSKYILEHSPCNVICIKDNEHAKERLEQDKKVEDDEEIDSFNDFERLHLHI